MNVSTCLNILREIKDVAFATVDENNQPQVRIIDVMLVEDNKLYFCTARGKDFYKQGAIRFLFMLQSRDSKTIQCMFAV